MSRPSPIVSYAQNHEDVVLARILKPWSRMGHWIDIGAGHPTFDSVTRLFSEFGWTGINVEPLTDEFALLEAQRPSDINLNCAVGSTVGFATLYIGPPESRGTSTLVAENAIPGRDSSSELETAVVPVRTLESIMDLTPWEIDFIKIDVEGMEADVITSADWRNIAAKIVVVEATYPNTDKPSHEPWESVLLDAGYDFSLFDGLNRFYSHRERCRPDHLPGATIWYPATVQDDFISHEMETLRAQISELRAVAVNFQTIDDRQREYIASLETHLAAKTDSLQSATTYASSIEELLKQLRARLAQNEAKRIELRRELDDATSANQALINRVEKCTANCRPTTD